LESVKAGARVGYCELLSPLGAGGMGEVWKARDTQLDRPVAIKFPQVQFSKRFEREARAIAALNHPNIAQIYDVGDDYIVMEYVDGEPVRSPGEVRKLLDIAGARSTAPNTIQVPFETLQTGVDGRHRLGGRRHHI